MPITETVEVAFAPCVLSLLKGLSSAESARRLEGSLMVNGRTVPLTVNEPRAKIRSKLPPLEDPFHDILVYIPPSSTLTYNLSNRHYTVL